MKKTWLRNYGITILSIIILIMIFTIGIIVSTSKSFVPHINVTINDENDSIYLYLQNNYDNYYSQSISITALDRKNKVEIYLASYISDGNEYFDYLYYCPRLEEGTNVYFSLYRDDEKLEYYNINFENDSIGVINFKKEVINRDDLVKITIKKDNLCQQSIVKIDYQYEHKLSKTH